MLSTATSVTPVPVEGTLTQGPYVVRGSSLPSATLKLGVLERFEGCRTSSRRTRVTGGKCQPLAPGPSVSLDGLSGVGGLGGRVGSVVRRWVLGLLHRSTLDGPRDAESHRTPTSCPSGATSPDAGRGGRFTEPTSVLVSASQSFTSAHPGPVLSGAPGRYSPYSGTGVLCLLLFVPNYFYVVLSTCKVYMYSVGGRLPHCDPDRPGDPLRSEPLSRLP